MKIEKYISSTILIFALSTVLILSLWQSRYSLDPHHWGLMLSNAKDINEGLIPYKDISIAYGIITPLVQAISMSIFTDSLISIAFITIIAYLFGLIAVFKLSKFLTNDIELSTYIVLTCILIHPIVIYPWPNYIAFPFLLVGIYKSINNENRNVNTLMAGLAFGIAALTRPEYLLFSLAFLSVNALIDILTKNCGLKRGFVLLVIGLSGLALPVGIFIVYITAKDIFEYWIGITWKLPTLAVPTQFTHMSGWNIFSSFYKNSIEGFKSLNARWMIIYSMIVVNVVYVIFNFNRLKLDPSNPKKYKLAIASLLLIGGSLHLPEIFRISTGSIVGIITVYIILKKIKFHRIYFVATSIALVGTIASISSGNYFIPNEKVIKSSKNVENIRIFKWQLWSESVTQYYYSIKVDMETIKKKECGVRYIYNYTMDVFLYALSPFPKYQMLPYHSSLMDFSKEVRPDLLSIEEKGKDKDIVIMKMIPNEELESFEVRPGYYVYKSYLTPEMVFIPVNHTLIIMVPDACKNK